VFAFRKAWAIVAPLPGMQPVCRLAHGFASCVVAEQRFEQGAQGSRICIHVLGIVNERRRPGINRTCALCH
jgi:hypothetical protein